MEPSQQPLSGFLVMYVLFSVYDMYVLLFV